MYIYCIHTHASIKDKEAGITKEDDSALSVHMFIPCIYRFRPCHEHLHANVYTYIYIIYITLAAYQLTVQGVYMFGM